MIIVNQSELIEDALIRELQEEIGLDLNQTEHTLELFTSNQRDELEYDWDEKTQIVELYFKIVIPDEYNLHIRPLEEVAEFVWVDSTTDLDTFSYRVLSRKDVYLKAQKSLLK